ncbi:hypothetical protein [Thalassotalea profundi]|uniref:Uncharacterized protein n=1 Tax=Thalassotalea profundi TaxID=2036687 RepID=A0ABQ3IP18_9GAMM|nr:hypothetical protein [Thalassotalea profundi]GHE87945.1 hypothetical protein GCM10011501_16890 [Thalassotalea profundi]
MYWLIIISFAIFTGLLSQKYITNRFGILIPLFFPCIIVALYKYYKFYIIGHDYTETGVPMIPLSMIFDGIAAAFFGILSYLLAFKNRKLRSLNNNINE